MAINSDILEKWGLPDNVSDDQVRSKYRLLVQTCHPDRSSSPNAVEEFMSLQEEYRQIKTAVGRRAVLARRCAPGAEPSVKKKDDKFIVPASNVIVRVEILPSVSLFGGPLQIKTKVASPCKCTLKGRPLRSCKSCHGAGQIFKNKEFEIDVPKGTPPGKPIRCKGAGNKGTEGVGDIIIITSWKDSNGWFVEGTKLILEVPLPESFDTGGEFIFRHADGATAKINMPPIIGDNVAEVLIPRSDPHIGGFSGATIKAFKTKDAAESGKFRMNQYNLALKHVFRNLLKMNSVKFRKPDDDEENE